MSLLNGHLGQVVGPFPANKDLLDDDGAIGVFTPQKERPVLYKLGIQAPKGTIVKINNANIKIGITGIYEIDLDMIPITSIIFPNSTQDDVIIDFIYTGNVI